MSKTNLKGCLVLRAAHEKGVAFSWVYRSRSGHYSQGRMGTDTLPLATEHCQITFLIPASRVLFARIVPATRLKKPSAHTLLWQIEGELFTEVESLHAVILSQDEEGYSVAAVDKSLLADWLQQLQAAGIMPDAVHPDVMAIPCRTAVKFEHEWLVRHRTDAGFCAREENLEVIWQAVASGESVHCCSAPVPDIAGWQAAPEKPVMALLLDNPPQSPSFLSGSFQPRVVVTGLLGFKALVMTSLVSLLLLTGLPFFQGYYQQLQAQNLTAISRQLIREYLLDIPDDAPPQRWLQERLSGTLPASSSRGLSAILEESHAFLKGIQQGNITRFNWDGDRQQLSLIIENAPENLRMLADEYATESLIITAEQSDEINTVQVVITRRENE